MQFKKIKPSIAYANGKRMTAEAINVVSRDDDLFGNVVFRYTLFNASGEWAGESCLTCKYTQSEKSKFLGLDEDGATVLCAWDASADGAYTVVAEAIGLEFVHVDKTAFFEA